MDKIVITLYLLLFATTINAQQQLNNYVKEGLSSNLGVKQLNADYTQALWALKEAKRMYGPNLDVVTSYTHTFKEGITMPAEDSTNLLSEGLHKMLEQSNSGIIKNGKIYFPLQQQYSAGVQLTQTVYNPELRYNRDMKDAGSQRAKAQLEDFKISLEADIRSAYFQYLEAWYIKAALTDGMDIAAKNLHSVENLIATQKATKDALYKSRANVSLVATKQRNAENTLLKAQYYFNFLLNRNMSADINIDSAYVFDPVKHYTLRIAESNDEHQYQLDNIHYMEITVGSQMKMVLANKLPQVQFSTFAGLNTQGLSESYTQRPMIQLKLSLKWNLFNMGLNNAKYKQAEMQRQSIQQQFGQQQQQLLLNEKTAYSDVSTQLNNYASINDNYINAEVYYKVVEEKFQLGMAGILDITDAENLLLQANIDRQQWYYDLQMKTANYLKTTGKTISIL
jgi:outer membrane protein TolC